MRLPTRKKELERQQTEEFDVYVTKEKLERMKRDVQRLETKERGEAAAEVVRTGEMGDFSENAGYQWAKANLRRINGRILTLTEKINRAIIIDETSSDGVIRIGSTVTIRANDREFTYQILGSQETNPSLGRISHNSPIGQALLGHRVGDRIDHVRGGVTIAYDVIAVR
ncbi:MAG: GreA/GreB family elongation factor [Patescibacteria group bacterium]